MDMGLDSDSGLGYGYADPMVLEAQLHGIEGLVEGWVKKGPCFHKHFYIGPLVMGENDSSESCPYPPGFGPCSSSTHFHQSSRFQDGPEVVNETQFHEIPICDEATTDRVQEAGRQYSDEGSTTPTPETDDGCSEETLYKINPDVHLSAFVEGLAGGVETEARATGSATVSTLAGADVCERRGSERSVSRHRDIEESGQGDVEESIEESSWNNKFPIEAGQSKKVWDKGGLFFYSSEEEELLDKLDDRKAEKRRLKKQRLLKRAPSIHDRSLASRIMRKNKRVSRIMDASDIIKGFFRSWATGFL
ncbi:hypothetical protein PIB30_034506 [Stylosanthes scabra]|uniref:Uncharacterized protein n=1 Tax=Stylosanthes scabra TaxID=79078 RepID=A0ABU6YD77_9FABA|nr:hypothetical protein [Stylosanthes scabra]